MKPLLNTLYVTTQGAHLARDNETLAVRLEGETLLRVPVHTLGGVVCFGRISVTPQLMELCAENKVALSFLTEYGRFLARVQGPVSGNVLLRREQYRRADNPEASAEVARAVVAAKIANCRTVLLRAVRDQPAEVGLSASSLQTASNRLANLVERLPKEESVDEIRGREGEAANVYFGVFDHLITAQKEDFRFAARIRRPPLDNVNALLSFHYTLLAHDVASALETVGLDPAVGFLHRDRPGRPGLALDLMEEFRPILGDRMVLSLINRRQVQAKGFKITESGAVQMDDGTRKEVLINYQKRKQEEITHPFLGEKVYVGLLPFVQALLFARHLRGDLDGYPPFIWK
jgi:CRISPR-associated protein Cas1